MRGREIKRGEKGRRVRVLEGEKGNEGRGGDGEREGADAARERDRENKVNRVEVFGNTIITANRRQL